MSHARTQIRDAVIAQLTGLLTTGPRIHASRMYGGDPLPCLLVHADDEDVAPATIGNVYERSLTLRVEGFAMAGTGLDDTLDQIALEVETAMAEDERFMLDSVEADYDDTLQKPVGRIVLAYRITYFTAANAPQTIIS